MKQVLKILFSIIILTNFALIYTCCGPSGCGLRTCCDSCDSKCFSCCTGPCDAYPFLAHRSQSENAAREIAGWQPFINRYDMENHYGTFSVAVEYTNTFRKDRLTQFLFGNDLINGNTLLVQGGMVENRTSNAWLADYFGLPRDFESNVKFCPSIKNVIADLNFYVGLDGLAEGLFFRVHMPIVWTDWSLNMYECVINPGTDETGKYPAGYMSDTEITIDHLATKFCQAISGVHTWGDVRQSMYFGIMTNCKLAKTRLSDIQAAFGWNFISNEDYHFGLSLRAAAPTGNKPEGIYLFEPIVGNGRHWELGSGITSSWIFWRSKEEKSTHIGVWMDANITHMFRSEQCRSFDFCGKPNSRYMLLEQMGINADKIRMVELDDPNPIWDEAVLAKYQYQKNLIPAINWSTFKVDVTIDVQADIVIKLGYIRDNFNVDLGYNLWVRTGEKFCYSDYCCEDCCCCPTDPGKIYALKGDAYIYGFNENINGDNQAHALPMSATQSEATIHSGKNFPAQNDNPAQNPRIDNPNNPIHDTPVKGDKLVFFGDTDVAANYLKTATVSGVPSRSSFPPKLITCADLNMCDSPGALTHKLFINLNYVWTDRQEIWIPFFGIGGEAEFGNMTKCCCPGNPCGSLNSSCESSNSCGPCGCCTNSSGCCNSRICGSCFENNCKKKAGISQWGVWIKGGISFD